MGIGAGVFLLAIGAILTFAVEWDPDGVALEVVGWILMAAGAIAVLMDLMIFAPRRRAVHSQVVYEDQPPAY